MKEMVQIRPRIRVLPVEACPTRPGKTEVVMTEESAKELVKFDIERYIEPLTLKPKVQISIEDFATDRYGLAGEC